MKKNEKKKMVLPVYITERLSKEDALELKGGNIAPNFLTDTNIICGLKNAYCPKKSKGKEKK